MARNLDNLRLEQIAARLRRLRALETDAAEGLKLHKASDRIRAALELTRAWEDAKSRGLAKAHFEQEVLEGLRREHGGRTEFRLNRYTLKRSEMMRLTMDGITPRDVAAYAPLREPQKSLDAYLAGLRVAARHCDADPDEWMMDMLSKTSLWPSQQTPSSMHSSAFDATDDMAEEADIPAETLAILLNRLGQHLASTNRLAEAMASIRETPCRWDMFEKRLVPSTTSSMDREIANKPPIGNAVYFEEMAPFPSVPLLRVPLVTRRVTLGLMSNWPLHRDELPEDEASMIYAFASGVVPVKGRLPVLGRPPEANIDRFEGHVTFYREVRLALAPVDRHGWGAVLEFRPFLSVDLPKKNGDLMRHHVANAFDPDLARVLFYPLSEEGRLVWPTIEREGEIHRVACLAVHDSMLDANDALQHLWAEGLNSSISTPFGLLEPWYLTYAAASATELRHWLAPEVDPSDEPFTRPWQREDFPDDAYTLNLPPQLELFFPFGGAATDVENCLHNGLIEQALQEAIDRLLADAAALRVDLSAARESNAQRLLNRWRDPLP